MIKLTRLNQSELVINAEMIEFVEAIPDTIVTLVSGKKIMVAESVPNVYILEGGINNWLLVFGTQYEQNYCSGMKETAAEDELRYNFNIALGSGCPAAFPDPEEFEFEFEPKIKLELKRAPAAGGCG